jgi:hypothetical protein
MSAGHTLRDAQVVLFLKARCCVIAADGRVRSAEIKALSGELDKLGVSHSPDELSALVVEYSKAIHAAKPEVYAESLSKSLESIRNTKWSAALQWALHSMSRDENAAGSQERKVKRVLTQAMGVRTESISPTTSRFPLEKATRLTAAIAPLLFSAGMVWYLLGPSLFPSWYYSLPAMTVVGERADWVTFSDWKLQAFGNRLQAVVTYHPKERSMLPRPTDITYKIFDKAGVKLGGQSLHVPKIEAGEKAMVTFHLEKGTRRLEISVGSL